MIIILIFLPFVCGFCVCVFVCLYVLFFVGNKNEFVRKRNKTNVFLKTKLPKNGDGHHHKNNSENAILRVGSIVSPHEIMPRVRRQSTQQYLEFFLDERFEVSELIERGILDPDLFSHAEVS